LSLKVVVTPDVGGVTLRVTGELKPFWELIVMVEVTEPDGCTVNEFGEDKMVKSPVGGGGEVPYTAVNVCAELVAVNVLSLFVEPVSDQWLK
jgi:hypothetical protein